MRKICLLLVLWVPFVLIFFSCKKYKDDAPKTDPRLTNPYCNDPAAVNYNWGFPGVPDNSKCFYPTDLFSGTYLYVDSLVQASTGLKVGSDTIYIHIFALSHTRIAVTGFCSSGDSLFLTARGYNAAVDSLVGDTTTFTRGQYFCTTNDTVNGTMVDNLIDTSVHVNFQVKRDSTITYHIGRAIKQ